MAWHKLRSGTKHLPRGSASFPMTFGEMPAIALMYPAVSYPALTRVGTLPVTRNPFVAPAIPSPIAAEPYIPNRGRGAIFFESRRRRSARHYCAYVVTVRVRSYDDASAEQRG